MKDAVSIPRVKLLHPKIRDEVFLLIGKAETILSDNVAIRVVQGLRTIAEQNALYAQGRTKPGKKVTNAKGGSSFHNYGLAIDFAILIDKDRNGTYESLSWEVNDSWKQVVKVFEDAGWFWGGKFSSLKDYPHLQKTFGYTWQKLLVKYNNSEFIAENKYVVI